MATHPMITMRLWGRSALEGKLLSAAGKEVRHAYLELEDPSSGMRLAPPTTGLSADLVQAGVTPAAGFPKPPAYVQRDIDGRIDAALKERPFVLLDGDAAAGKTRTLLEGLRRSLPDYEIAAPEPTDLDGLVARLGRLRDPLRERGLVLLLDDIDEYLGPGRLGPSTFEQVLSDDVRVVGTIRRQRFNQIIDENRRAAAVLDLAHILRLAAKPTGPERQAFVRCHPRLKLDDEGIGEHFVATRNLTDRYVSASDDAITLTALLIDWRRITGAPSMEQVRVERAFEALRGDASLLREALHEATTENRRGDRLVHREADRLTVRDYLLEFDDRNDGGAGARRAVSPRTWDVLLGLAAPDEAAAIAQSANARGAPAIAIAALQIARTSPRADVAAWALISLGRLSADLDPDAASEAWLAALDQGDAVGVVEAAESLMHQADLAREDLDEEVVDKIRLAVLNTDSAGARNEFQDVLAALSARRGDLDTLQELFQRSMGDNIGRTGLTYTRALLNVGDAETAANVLDTVLEHAAEGTRGKALLIHVALGLDPLRDPTGDAGAETVGEMESEAAADELIEAIDLCGKSIAPEVRELVRRFEDAQDGHRVLRRLAGAGDQDALQEGALLWPEVGGSD